MNPHVQIKHLRRMVEYHIDMINIKVRLGDWHAVADFAMDIRDLEAKIQVWEELALKFGDSIGYSNNSPRNTDDPLGGEN